MNAETTKMAVVPYDSSDMRGWVDDILKQHSVNDYQLTNRLVSAFERTPAMTANRDPQAGEAVAWGCFENGQLDERMVYRDERRAGDAAFAFTPSLEVRPLYASPQDDRLANTKEGED